MNTNTNQAALNVAYVKAYAAKQVGEHWGAVVAGAFSDAELLIICGGAKTEHGAMRAMRGTLRGVRRTAGVIIARAAAAKPTKAPRSRSKVVDDIAA